ncbi:MULTISPECIES: serine/threonine-protein kinase [unclassified Streptomyces]|uniref:serine/threonine-protein kinase n=1 Tax=unclassified Streptomyces TaxID=2593676 RepID=UPI0023666AC1|nr:MULTISPECIES: serine/threonine-protein kinase [unclassified Streptomyces]MDF3145185.1 protein kinase [Streptomyces sp. T21Q-yed]WDF38952.1 protein kinase [Streptomyces sp. T12]
MLRPLDAGHCHGHAPRWIGPYRLLAELGSGGMGTVYLGRRDDVPERPLAAVKTVRDDLVLDREFRLRFRREAEAARRVRSPWTTALTDADPDSDTGPPWLATEYVAGPPLNEAVARCGPLAVPVVRALGADLARALRAVHGARILHRDLKPANVLLSAAGPKVIDFGIAHAFDATVLTEVGVVVGSPGFMSPEHITGHTALTTASDVFCLGTVLCFAATGLGPFDDGEPAAVLHRIAQGQADLERVPTELRAVVEACLRPDPARRPTPSELVHLLDDGPPPRPGPQSRVGKRPFRWPPIVKELIAEYEVEIRRYDTAALDLPPPPPQAPLSSPVPTDSREPRRWGPRIAAVVATVAAAGALVALLPPLVSDSGGGSGRVASASPSATATTAQNRLPPAITGETIEFTADALSPRNRPSGWRPWLAKFSGAPANCALAQDRLLCTVVVGTPDQPAYRLEALDAAGGARKWRHDYRNGTQLAFTPAIVGDRVYTADGDGNGVAVLRLSDGKAVDKWQGDPGYEPVKALADGNVVYVSYMGSAGADSSSDMLFRAYRAENGEKLWEFVRHGAFPQDMKIAGDRLVAPGESGSFSADTAQGRAVDGVSHCMPLLPHRDEVLCSGEVLDARTLGKKSSLPMDTVLAVGDEDRAVGLMGEALVGADVSTGKQLWSVPYDGESQELTVLLSGERFLTIAADGVTTRAIDSGDVIDGPQAYRGWPDSRGTPQALLGGGVVYLAFDDGTVLTGHAP